MEHLKGAIVGMISGLLVPPVLALVVLMVGMFLFTGDGWRWTTFCNDMILMPLIIGVWVVPIGVVLGLASVITRRAIRQERRQIVPAVELVVGRYQISSLMSKALAHPPLS